MSIFTNRMYREATTIKVMVGIYCQHHHGLQVAQCPECSEIQKYALERLYHCPYQADKPSCKNCPIHCYKPSMKTVVKQVMRFAGPRMALRHPLLTIFHFIDDRHQVPITVAKAKSQGKAETDDTCPGPLNAPQAP